MKSPTRRRLFFDIETSPNIGFFWKPGYDLNINHQDIIHERAVICICYKWENDKTISSLSWDKNQDDKKMLEQFVKLMQEADEVVTHNGDRFDIKWIRTRALKHGIMLPYDITSLDTIKFARSKFYFNSNRLDYLGKFLGFGGKIDTGGMDLWKKVVLDKSKSALAHMVKYCKRDVQMLENIFHKLNPYVPAKSNFTQRASNCPECGSNDIIVNKHRISAAGIKKTTFQCTKCGKYHTTPTSKFNKAMEEV